MSALLAGLSLGFSAGIAPGPLMSLVITTALARGFGAGLRVAVAPLISDLPIVTAAVLFVAAVPEGAQALLAAGGGAYILYLGVDALVAARMARPAEAAPQAAAQDVLRGAVVNLLNPHPWLFWLGAGGPLLLAAWRVGSLHAAAFLFGFYALLVGSKIGVAWGVAAGRRFLTDRAYRVLLAASALLLFVFGALLLWQALGWARAAWGWA